MYDAIEESPLYPIANPKSIAFFGASNNITSMGTSQFMSIQELGFEGDLYPIHPTEEKVQGVKAYQSVMDLPEVPDLAVFVVPTQIVSELLEQCGRKGIRHAIVTSGGFKEVGGKGIQMEKELAEVADRYRIRLLGPNCIGVANPHRKLNTTFLRYLSDPGFIGMASQSGSFVTQMFDYLGQFGLGFSTAFSVGNELNVDLIDGMEYLAACPHTKVIALYIEGIQRGRRFMEAAREIVPSKPIVAVYVGGSETGKHAGFSHTGAMAGPDALYDGIFRQCGVLRARSMSEMFDFCWILGTMPTPRNARVVIQTHSGGPGVAAADACGRAGMEMPLLSKETRQGLAPYIPHTASIANPVDLTYTKNPMHYFSEIPEVLIRDRYGDMLMLYVMFPSLRVRSALKLMGFSEEQAADETENMIQAQCDSVQRIFRKHQKPIVGYTFRSLKEPLIDGLIRRGIPVFPGPERAARAMGCLVQYGANREKLLRFPGSHPSAEIFPEHSDEPTMDKIIS